MNFKNSKFKTGFIAIIFFSVFALPVFAAPAITNVSGTLAHGNPITIAGSGFGIKNNATQSVPAAPIVWDVTSEQFVGGVNKDAYHGFQDGSNINTQIWQHVNASYDEAVKVRYSTSRPQRNPFVQAHYASYDPLQQEAGMKLCLGMPWYPNGSEIPPGTQKRFYLSFYRKLKNGLGSVGSDDGSGKLLRVRSANSPNLSGFAAVTHSQYGTYSPSRAISSWVDAGPETDWVRWEMYLDANKKWFDVYKNGHYQQGIWSSVPGNLEQRPAADWRFNKPGKSGYEFDPPLAEFPAGDGLQASLFGYDDGHGTSLGQEIDMGEIYYDDTQARIEISDQPAWDDSPSSTAHSEVQGRLLSWNSNQISFNLYQGGFNTGSAAYVYVIDSDGNVSDSSAAVGNQGYPIIIGSGEGSDTTAPNTPSGLSVS